LRGQQRARSNGEKDGGSACGKVKLTRASQGKKIRYGIPQKI